MPKKIKDALLANSQVACIRSLYVPMIIGCAILSSVYLTAYPANATNGIFGVFWVFFGFVMYYKLKEANKKIMEQYNGS